MPGERPTTAASVCGTLSLREEDTGFLCFPGLLPPYIFSPSLRLRHLDRAVIGLWVLQ
jgi:hypothetical protein